MNVYVYTKCDEVRLELNGKIIEFQKANPDSKFTYCFSIPYEPGDLKAVGISKGKELIEKTLETTGPVEKMKIVSDRFSISRDRNDLAYLTIELVDVTGRRVPDSEANIKFDVEGEAEIVAVGNGNPREPKSFQSQSCNAFHGRCLVILRPTGKPGEVILTAKSDSLPQEKCVIKIQ
jgi:beta-galactosidase